MPPSGRAALPDGTASVSPNPPHPRECSISVCGSFLRPGLDGCAGKAAAASNRRRMRRLSGRGALCRRLLLRRAAVGEDAVKPFRRLFLVHVLGVHELAGEDLLRLHEHLLLASGETLFVVAKRKVPNDLGELEDV